MGVIQAMITRDRQMAQQLRQVVLSIQALGPQKLGSVASKQRSFLHHVRDHHKQQETSHRDVGLLVLSYTKTSSLNFELLSLSS